MIEFLCHKFIKINEEMETKYLNPTIEASYKMELARLLN